MIDKNNPDYTTPVQEAIWNAATDLVPLDVTLPMIPAEYHESCTQWHTYLTDLLNDMYSHTDEYLAVSDMQTYIRWFWIWLYKCYAFESGTFFASPVVHKKFVKKMGAPLLDFLCAKWGFHVATTEAEVRLTNKKYPLLLTAVHDILAAAYENYNVNCGDYLTFCDCRALVNYKRTYHDMIVLLNREGRAMAETICEYAITNGIKPAKCTYFNRVEFKKKGKIVFVLDVAKGKDLKINIGFAELDEPAFAKIAEAVDGYEDKAEFAKFWRQNLKKCTACNPDCQKRITPVEVFGLNCIVCQAYLRMFQPKKEDLKYIYRLISLRAMVIDAGISEPFYPGNG